MASRMNPRGLRILFAGMIAADPFQGGATWAVLQYLLGFRELGHDVLFVEPIKPESLRPAGSSLEQSENAAYFRATMQEFGLSDRAALLLAGTKQTVGLSYEGLRKKTCDADVFFNVSGMLQDAALFENIPHRVYFDLDPAFVQLWESVC